MQLTVKNGAVHFGDDIIFTGADLTVNEKEHIGLVGKNGCGKTTLLKVLTNELELTEGTLSNSGFKIGHLTQISLIEDITLEDYLRGAYKEIIELEARLEFLSENMGNDEKLIAEFSAGTERFRNLDGYSYKGEYHGALRSFGFTENDLLKKVSDFSGGERTKITLLRLLLSKPSLLLLDEPTNNLDIEAVEWLERFLSEYKGAFVVVSHDREFLDKTVKIVYEIERASLTRYFGNYSSYSLRKKQKYEEDLKRYKNDKAQADRLSALIERFRYKANKAAFAQSKIKQLERMGDIEKPLNADTSTFHGSFQPEYESGEEVLLAKDLRIGYDKLLSTVSFRLCKGEKLAILGGNGLGKSTLLKTLVGRIPSLGGEMRFGHQVKSAYFSQDSVERLSSATVLDEMLDTFPRLSPQEVRNILGSFLFRGEEVFKEISTLSGGERVRLALCKVLTSKPNLLILDEPTNHLDIPSKEALENILTDFKGAILFVSHDRFFIKRVSDKILVIQENGVSFFPEGYSEYKEKYSPALSPAEANKAEKKPQPVNVLKERSRIERRISTLERLLLESEQRTASLNEEMQSASSDYQRLQEISNDISAEEEKYNGYFSELSEKYELLEGLE